MKKCHSRWDVFLMKGLAAMMLSTGAVLLASCNDNGLEEGDPNYFTSSRGQFTATLDDGTTLFLIPGSASGTATVTYDGSNPKHWVSESATSVNVATYTGDLVIPETVKGSDGNTYTITAVGPEAFMGCRSLTSLSLPSTVQSIGEGAFVFCNTMTTVNVPEGVTDIPSVCFAYCQALTTVTLPSTVKNIARMAFFRCTGMTSVTLPDGLLTIGERAFAECPNSGFKEITIPACVTTIGDCAFGGRSNDTRDRITAYHVKASTPPTLEGALYQERTSVSPVIYVPVGSLSAYQAATGWSSLTIEEE